MRDKYSYFWIGEIGLDRGMAGGGELAPQVFYQRCPVAGDCPGQGEWFTEGERFTESPVVFEGRAMDHRPQAVYRKCRGLRGTGCPARHWPCAKRGKRRKSLCPRIKFALSPSIEVKGFRKLQKSFSLLDRARPVFSFSALRKRENGGCNEPAIIMAEIPLPVRASKIPPSRQGFPLQINLPPI